MGAVRAFLTLTDFLGTGFNVDHQQRARLSAATGDLGTAVQEYRVVLEGNGPVSVIRRLELAELAERQGARELAVESYQFVTAIWRHADPVLQPWWQEGGLDSRGWRATPARIASWRPAARS